MNLFFQKRVVRTKFDIYAFINNLFVVFVCLRLIYYFFNFVYFFFNFYFLLIFFVYFLLLVVFVYKMLDSALTIRQHVFVALFLKLRVFLDNDSFIYLTRNVNICSDTF